MPRGPKGEKRPADVIGNAVHVMRIATGEAEEGRGTTPGRAKGGRKGGKARARRLDGRTAVRDRARGSYGPLEEGLGRYCAATRG
jgi:hypothetical protein